MVGYRQLPPSDNQKRRTINDIFDGKVNSVIAARTQQTTEALKEIEKNFRTSMQDHIAYHRLLMESAKKSGDLPGAMRYKVMIETYQSVLDSYTLSGSYG